MTTDWNPDEFHDNYREALRKVIEDRIHEPEGGKRRKPRVQDEAPPESYNMMELLKRSVEGQKTASRKPAKRHRRKAG